jgi:hypothetical protein
MAVGDAVVEDAEEAVVAAAVEWLQLQLLVWRWEMKSMHIFVDCIHSFDGFYTIVDRSHAIISSRITARGEQ